MTVDAREQLSGEYLASIEADIGAATVDPEGLLGASAVLSISTHGAGGRQHRFAGIIESVEDLATGEPRRLRLMLAPALLCLDHDAQTERFQESTALDVIEVVLKRALEHWPDRHFHLPPTPPHAGGADGGTFSRRALCVRYGETTVQFFRRLLSEEGALYWIDSTADTETLVVGDGATSFRPLSMEPLLYAPASGRSHFEESVFAVVREHRAPSAAASPLLLPSESLRGASNVLAMAAGTTFRLRVGPGRLLPSWAEQAFVVTEVHHTARLQHYENSFVCVPAGRPLRVRRLPKPLALEDLAEVLPNTDGDQIWTDQHGRVRTRFLSDRPPNKNGCPPSSWIPVAQSWLGAGFGTQVVPRAGMLVRVEYMFGDPDRPVVTGCLPTSVNAFPSQLPEQKSRLTLRSSSLRRPPHDDRHCNEISLEDAACSEEVFLRAGRDLRELVLDDCLAETGRDNRRQIGHAQALDIQGNRAKVVNGGEAQVVGGRRTTTVGADELLTVGAREQDGGNRVVEVHGDAELVVQGGRTTTVGRRERRRIEGGRDQEVAGEDGGAALRVTGKRASIGDAEWRAEQRASSIRLAEGSAVVHPTADLRVSNPHGSLLLVRSGDTSLALKRLKISCGASRMIVDAEALTLRAPQVVAQGASGVIRLDSAGASTAGKNVTASAVMINELRGPVVQIADGSATGSQHQSAQHIDSAARAKQRM